MTALNVITVISVQRSASALVHEDRLVKPAPYFEASSLSQEKRITNELTPASSRSPGSSSLSACTICSRDSHNAAQHHSSHLGQHPLICSAHSQSCQLEWGLCRARQRQREGERGRVVIVTPPLSISILLSCRTRSESSFYALDFLLIHSGRQDGALCLFFIYLFFKKEGAQEEKHPCLVPPAAGFLSLVLSHCFPFLLAFKDYW